MPKSSVRYILAMCPILVVLGLMIWRKWGAHKAGAAGWLAGLGVGALWFGATPELFWVSQAKGLLLSVFVLGVMWPSLLLYHWVDRHNGIQAAACLLEKAIGNRGMCLVLLAWAVSGMLEGLAGFGLPIAVVAPMLVTLKVPPLRAVIAVAAGHSWAVTFGDMGVILQTLSTVVAIPVAELVPWCGLLLGMACLACGLAAAFALGQAAQWRKVVCLAVVMGAAQYGLAAIGLVPLSAVGAGLLGVAAYLFPRRLRFGRRGALANGRTPNQSVDSPTSFSNPPLGAPAPSQAAVQDVQAPPSVANPQPVKLALACYGGLTLLMALLTLIPFLRNQAQSVEWRPIFRAVVSDRGFITAAGPGQLFRPLTHPGILALGVVLLSMLMSGASGAAKAKAAAKATVQSAGLASVGVVFMVGISTFMEHCGMSYLLAQGLSAGLGAAYPVVSPCVGILGAFATGSNNNSNVLFGGLQKNVALLLHIPAPLLAAAQTAGGSLGSMLAPAKIVVGCTTVGQVGQEGGVLRQTVLWGIGMGILLGLITLLMATMR